MKKICCLFVLLTGSAWAQAKEPIRIATVPSNNIAAGELLREIDDHCAGVVLTVSSSKADYFMEAQYANPSSGRGNYVVALYGKDGDSVFHTATLKEDNAIKNVCEFLKASK